MRVPVVSIGNLTVGGTGKTPLTIFLGTYLRKHGRKPAIVSRGYLREGRGLVIVSDGRKLLVGRRQAGDEPYLMARSLPEVPVVVGPNRAVAGYVACGRFAPDIILMDDGFQHLKVHRDLDIVVIDSTDPFGNGRTLPRGILREPPNHILRADLIVLTRVDQADHLDEVRALIASLNPRAPVIETLHKPTALVHFQERRDLGIGALRTARVVALSSVGNPAAFERTLTDLGATLVDRWRLPNHHHYRRGPLADLVDRARDLNVAAVATTEKDVVRFPPGFAFHIPVWMLKIELTVVVGEEHFERLLTLRPKAP
jgi:tetraacyldisaccharide 4'-kinase